MKVILLAKNDYSFKNNETGELIEGSKLFYIFDNGVEPIILSLNSHQKNLHLLDSIKSIPGVYDLEMKNDVRKGQIVQTISNMKYIKSIDLLSLMA